MNNKLALIIVTFVLAFDGGFTILQAYEVDAKPDDSAKAVEAGQNYEEVRAAARKAQEAGEFAEAVKLHMACVEVATSPEQIQHARFDLACCHAQLKQVDEALDQLELCFKAGYPDFDCAARTQALQAVAEHPRYREMIANYRRIAQEREMKDKSLMVLLAEAVEAQAAENHEVAARKYLAIAEMLDPDMLKREIYEARLSAAKCYALLGKADEALKQLELCLNSECCNVEEISKDKGLDSIRGNLKFKKLLAIFNKRS